MQELPDALNPAGHSGTLNVPTRPLQPNLSTPAGQVIGAGGVLMPDVECVGERRLPMAAGAIYRAELAKGLAELGYRIEKQVMVDADGRPTGDISFGVVGAIGCWPVATRSSTRATSGAKARASSPSC